MTRDLQEPKEPKEGDAVAVFTASLHQVTWP